MLCLECAVEEAWCRVALAMAALSTHNCHPRRRFHPKHPQFTMRTPFAAISVTVGLVSVASAPMEGYNVGQYSGRVSCSYGLGIDGS